MNSASILKALETIEVTDKELTLPSSFSISAINTVNQTNDELLLDIGRLRYKVWQQEGMDMTNAGGQDCLIDNIDHTAIIWAVFDGNKIIATARLNLYDELSHSPTSYMHNDLNSRFATPVATLTRLVVDQNYRRLKLGKILDRLRLTQAKIIGAKSVMLMCPPARVGSLLRMGFKCLGKATPSKLWPDADWMIMAFDF